MSRLTHRFAQQDVKISHRERVYDGFFKLDALRLRHRCYEGGWSQPLSRELFIRDDAVCVLLYDPSRDEVVLIEQFRIGALAGEQSPWMWELVAGIVEQGETPEQVAYRESEEEAGAKILALEPIHNYHVSPGGSEEQVHLFCGRVDSSQLGGFHGLPEEGEDIRVEVIARTDAFEAMASGLTNNAAALIALQWLQLNWTKLQKKWC